MERRNDPTRLSLPSDLEIVVTRDFDASPAALFQAWTEPARVRRWVPCPTMTMPVCEIDLREGGPWRWVLRDPATGVDHPLSGHYTDVARPDRLVFTRRHESFPGSDHVVTVSFVERGGVTTVTQVFLHPSKQSRDGHLASGMEVGLEETWLRLADLVGASASASAARANP